MSDPMMNPENEPGFNTAMVELHTATSDDRAWSPEWADEKMRPRLYEALSILGRALDRERARAEKAEARLKELENDYGGNVSLNLRIQELEAALAAAVKERDEVVAAAFRLLVACLRADAIEELSGEVDGGDMQAVRNTLAECPECDGFGTRDKLPHEDEVIEDSNVCPSCEGWGFLPEARRLRAEAEGR